MTEWCGRVLPCLGRMTEWGGRVLPCLGRMTEWGGRIVGVFGRIHFVLMVLRLVGKLLPSDEVLPSKFA